MKTRGEVLEALYSSREYKETDSGIFWSFVSGALLGGSSFIFSSGSQVLGAILLAFSCLLFFGSRYLGLKTLFNFILEEWEKEKEGERDE